MGQNSVKQGSSGRRAAREREDATEHRGVNGHSGSAPADAEPTPGAPLATAPARDETATGDAESQDELFAFDGDYASGPSAAVEQREPEIAWQSAPVEAARAWTRDRADAAVRWVRGLSVESWVWIGILALATVLRFWGLGDKPLHHDESMHAYFSLLFARDPSSYVYDPLLHGPFQFHAEGIVFAIIIDLSRLLHVSSAYGNPWINDATARILPATTGVVLVGLTYGLRRQLGRIGAPLAAFLLAVSPTFVYFSRFLREDIYFACFTYATVVCAVQYAQKRTTRWLVATALVFVLAYATLEAIFLNVAIWVSFLAIVVVWELGHTLSERLPRVFSDRERAFFGHAAPLLLLGAVGSAVALVGLHELNLLSSYINKYTTQTDVQVAQLENATVTVLLYASMALALVVIGVLVKQIYYDVSPSRADAVDAEYPDQGDADDSADEEEYEPRRGWGARLAQRLDPAHQPFLRLVLSISWVSWFVAFVAGWVLFAALYWVVPGEQVSNIAQGFQVGVGKGIWQGLYYWLEQQQVARGGQPWYYYVLLIPLYEQLAVVFGLAGLVRSLVRPTRFRLFLAYWFVASFVLYSWAGEKMPWLTLHMLLPLLLLAAVALEGLVQAGLKLLGELAGPRWDVLSLAWIDDVPAGDALAFAGAGQSGGSGGAPLMPASALSGSALPASTMDVSGASTPLADMDILERLAQVRMAAELAWARVRRALSTVRVRTTAVALGLLSAVVLLVPMLYGMLVLSYHDAANGPHEMMVYVQTTTDVTTVMDKLTRADQLMYAGRHQLRVAVGAGEEWPFWWYLRDYALDPHPSTYLYAEYPITNAAAPREDVLLLTPSDAATFMAEHPGQYRAHEYQLRSWWDEGYKPPPCVPTPRQTCSTASSWGAGVGPLLWMSYGDNPPPHAHFNLGLAASRLWNWLWFRKPLGYANGSYDFTLVVRNGVPIQP